MTDGAAVPALTCDDDERRTILVVEDEALIRLATADLLRHCGHVVIEAATAEEALAVLAAGRRIDAIFSDVQMPGRLDGIDLAVIVAERHPLTPVVLTSANLPDARMPPGLGFIRKPYRDADVVAALRAGTHGVPDGRERQDEDVGRDERGAGGRRRGPRP